jgi:peptidoglycan/xylan/chitin deacetylase (PgdA/CDA1 family)
MGAPARSWVFRLLLALASITAVASVFSAPVPWWLRLTVLTAGVAFGVDQAFRRVPAFDPLRRICWRLPGPRGPRGPRGPKRCAITFDDGPSQFTAAVLDILKEEGVPATFFVLGANVERHPAIVRRIQAEGHAVGIHGMDHTKLAGAGEATVERQVLEATAALDRIGVRRAPLYRTPHGFKSRSVFRVARRHGLALWAWSRGVWDTDRPESAILVRRSTRLARSGMVLLLHDGRGDEMQPDVAPMVAALREILRELKRRQFAFVRLADA